MIGRASVIREEEPGDGYCEVWSLLPESATSLVRNHAIRYLDVHGFRTGLTVPEYSACAAALASSTCLSRLSIDGYNEGFGDAGLAALGASSSLTTLHAPANLISCAGVLEMLRRGAPPLIHLALPFNYIGDAGASRLCALRRLTQLNLRCNCVSDATAPALAALPCLTSLDVSSNRLSPHGATLLLPHSASLTHLDFQLRTQDYADASPGDVDNPAMHAALRLNFTLHTFVLAWHTHNYVRRCVGTPHELLRGRALALAGRATTRHMATRLPLWALQRVFVAVSPPLQCAC